MKKNAVIILRILSIAIGAVFLGVGIAKGEYNTVLQKAIRVCLECIGIG